MHSQDVHVADIIGVMEKLAPPVLAEAWDNCGLQVGSRRWPVKKVWVALDPLLSVIEKAIEKQVDLVITHHPLVFHPLKQIDLDTPVGKAIGAAVRGKVAVYAAHTNLDSASGGINHLLAEKMGLQNLEPLEPVKTPCTENKVDEQTSKLGLGRIGTLPSSATLDDLARRIKTCLGIEHVKVAGDTGAKIRRVAVCSGAGSGLLERFLSSDGQVFISGDLKYHDAREVEAAGKSMIDVGHFASEHIIIDALVNKLQDAAKTVEWPILVEACRLEQDPFRQI